MDLRTGIIETANALGMDPAHLATIISYETAGTFDPTKRGPTTQWGQHRGLIQWGQPQAKQYGVDWDDPLGSQLGADGAIVRYYRDRGWQPGMGLMDAYSIVNAGAPGRYSASDANNGGAPGTVADKVNHQMAGHWQKALALLGGSSTQPMPGTQQMPQGVLGAVAGSTNPAQPETQGLLAKLLGTTDAKVSDFASALSGLGQQEPQPMQAPQVNVGPGYQKQGDSLSRALESFAALRANRRI